MVIVPSGQTGQLVGLPPLSNETYQRLDRTAHEMLKLPIPEGELLPAEERLQKVLKAIEDRIRKEREVLDAFVEAYDRDANEISMQDIVCQRGFIAGLDIAWSLAKTESLRRTDSP